MSAAKPPSGKPPQKEAQLAKALRANLRRRKAAPQPEQAPSSEKAS